MVGNLERRHPDVLSIEDVQLGGARPHGPLAVVNAELKHVRSGIAGLERRLKGLHGIQCH